MGGVYITKDDVWPWWLLDYPLDYSTSHDFSTGMTLQLLCVSIGLHFTLHLVTMDMAHNGDVAETAHDTTWHDTVDMY